MKLALWVLCVIVSNALAQQELCFKDFYDIMENSKFTYTISELKEHVQDTATPPLPISIDTKTIEKQNGIEIVSYKRSSESRKLLEEVEENYKKGNNEKVRVLCTKMLGIDSTDSRILTYLGETYQKDENYNEALYWCGKALETNYNNWLTHILLGKCYLEKAKTDSSYNEKCIKEYAVAMILNRSVRSFEVNYQKICKEYNKSYSIWQFVPQCNIRKNKKTVYIETDKTWLGYAVAKAVREYEPDYSVKKRTDMANVIGRDTEGEREYLLSLAIPNINGSTSVKNNIVLKDEITDPTIVALVKAINQGMLNEYIIYELWLPKNPIMAYGLSKNSFDKLVKYVLTVRTS